MRNLLPADRPKKAWSLRATLQHPGESGPIAAGFFGTLARFELHRTRAWTFTLMALGLLCFGLSPLWVPSQSIGLAKTPPMLLGLCFLLGAGVFFIPSVGGQRHASLRVRPVNKSDLWQVRLALYSSFALAPILVLHGITLSMAGLDFASWSEAMFRGATALLAALLLTIANAQLTQKWSFFLFLLFYQFSFITPYVLLIAWVVPDFLFPLSLLGAACPVMLVCRNKRIATRPVFYLAGPLILIGFLINLGARAGESRSPILGEMELRPLKGRAGIEPHLCGILRVPLSSTEEYVETRREKFTLRATEPGTTIYQTGRDSYSISSPTEKVSDSSEVGGSIRSQVLEFRKGGSGFHLGRARAAPHAAATLTVEGILERYSRKELGTFVLDGENKTPDRSHASSFLGLLYDGRDLLVEIRAAQPTNRHLEHGSPSFRQPAWEIALVHPDKRQMARSSVITDLDAKPLSLLAPFSGFELATFKASFDRLPEDWPNLEERPSTLVISTLFQPTKEEQFSVESDSYEVSDWICGFEGTSTPAIPIGASSTVSSGAARGITGVER